MGMRALNIVGLAKRYSSEFRRTVAPVLALDGVTIHADQGEILGIAGPRGAGKSTLMLCAAGLVRADEGSVSWYGSQVTRHSVPPGLAFVPPRSAYYSFLTVREALEYYATLHDLQTRERAMQIDNAVKEVSLQEYAGRRVGALAPSALQRLGLAQALIGSPRALLLDETLAGEGLLENPQIREILRKLTRRGVTILISAEDAGELHSVADRVVMMHRGRAVEEIPRASEVSMGTPHTEWRDIRTNALERVC